MVLDRQKVWMNGIDGRTDGRTDNAKTIIIYDNVVKIVINWSISPDESNNIKSVITDPYDYFSVPQFCWTSGKRVNLRTGTRKSL